jgi:hypothetical protein
MVSTVDPDALAEVVESFAHTSSNSYSGTC